MLETLLGQPMVMEYKPDGYTLYYADSGPLTVASVDPIGEFARATVALAP